MYESISGVKVTIPDFSIAFSSELKIKLFSLIEKYSGLIPTLSLAKKNDPSNES